MPRKTSPTLTDAELKLMEILWRKGPATVNEVVSALPDRPPVAYSTALTILRILERKGYVRHLRRGRAFVFEPAIGRGEVRQGAIRYILSRFFNDSPELLILNVLENEDLNREELQRLRKMLEESE